MLFGEAYGKAVTPQNATSGFAKTGPLNPYIFLEELFEPAEITTRDDPQIVRFRSTNAVIKRKVNLDDIQKEKYKKKNKEQEEILSSSSQVSRFELWDGKIYIGYKKENTGRRLYMDTTYYSI